MVLIISTVSSRPEISLAVPLLLFRQSVAWWCQAYSENISRGVMFLPVNVRSRPFASYARLLRPWRRLGTAEHQDGDHNQTKQDRTKESYYLVAIAHRGGNLGGNFSDPPRAASRRCTLLAA